MAKKFLPKGTIPDYCLKRQVKCGESTCKSDLSEINSYSLSVFDTHSDVLPITSEKFNTYQKIVNCYHTLEINAKNRHENEYELERANFILNRARSEIEEDHKKLNFWIKNKLDNMMSFLDSICLISFKQSSTVYSNAIELKEKDLPDLNSNISLLLKIESHLKEFEGQTFNSKNLQKSSEYMTKELIQCEFELKSFIKISNVINSAKIEIEEKCNDLIFSSCTSMVQKLLYAKDRIVNLRNLQFSLKIIERKLEETRIECSNKLLSVHKLLNKLQKKLERSLDELKNLIDTVDFHDESTIFDITKKAIRMRETFQPAYSLDDFIHPL